MNHDDDDESEDDNDDIDDSSNDYYSDDDGDNGEWWLWCVWWSDVCRMVNGMMSSVIYDDVCYDDHPSIVASKQQMTE